MDDATNATGRAFDELISDLAGFLRGVRSDPMVLDLDGDGIELTSLANSVTRFDLDEDGVAERTGWVGAHDALLVNDANANGQVDGIAELIGSARVDGFDALAPLDANADGRVDALDPAFANLRVWRDFDASGTSDAGELLTPAEAGIRSFNLAFTQVDRDVAGNTVARIGSYTRVDGITRDMGSVLFALDQRTALPEVPPGFDMRPLLALPNLAGSADVPDLRTAMALDPELRAMVEAIVGGGNDYPTMRHFTAEVFQPMVFRWLGVDGPPPAGDEDKPQYVRAIEAITGQIIALNEFQQSRLPQVAEQWKDTVDALTVHFLVQAAEVPFLNAYLDAGESIAALDPEAVNFADGFAAVLTRLDGTLAAVKPPSGIGASFAPLSIDPDTGQVGGDFNMFVRSFIEDMPPYLRPMLVAAGSPPPPLYNFNGALVSQEWYSWYLNHGSFLFDVAGQMGLGADSVMNASGWTWILMSAINRVGTDSDDVLGRVATTGSATGSERLNGLDGNDTLHGNDGVDILIGGAGNDILRGGSGSDMYVYGKGDGLDQIVDESGADDTVYFSNEFDAADLQVARVAGTNDLLVHFGDVTQGIILTNQWSSANAAVEQFHFVAEDGLDAGDIASRYLATLVTSGADAIVGSWAGERITGLDGDDTISGLGGDDTLDGGAGNDSLNGGSGDDVLSGGLGNDTLKGSHDNDKLIGGLGDDVLSGDGGDDTYVFNLGDGQDVITEESGAGGWGGLDTLVFGIGIAPDDIVVTQADNGKDLILSINGTTDRITINDTMVTGDQRVEQVRFADGTALTHAELVARSIAANAGDDVFYGSFSSETVSGGAGNDILNARGGNDTVIGGTGDDVLSGDGGDDTYVFNLGDGRDLITEESGAGGWGGLDTIVFGSGIAPGDIIVTQADGGKDLILSISGTTDRITINDTMVTGDQRVEQVHFADGTVWTHADLVARSIAANAGDDVFYGSFSGESVSGGAGNDILKARGGNDVLIGGLGNDTLSGDGGDDTYVFNLGDGQDLISEESGAGGWGGNDTISFGLGIASSDIVVTQVDGGKDLILSIAGTTDRITLNDTMVTGDQRVEQVRFTDGTTLTHAELVTRSIAANTGDDVFYGSFSSETVSGGTGNDILKARGGNDTLIGGLGNDALSGDGGDDTYIFSRGDGQDMITEESGAGGWGGSDTLILGVDIAAADIIVTQANGGRDLVLSIHGTTDRITIRDTMVTGDQRVEQVRFADNMVWTHAELVARSMVTNTGDDTFYGSYDSETLNGGTGNDILRARGGNDTIIGGLGNDTVSGDGGDDTYRFSLGDGQDIIIEESGAGGWGGNDTIVFGAGVLPSSIVVTQANNGRDLVLSIKGTTDRITIQDTIIGGDQRVEQVSFADGTVWSHAELITRSTRNFVSGGAGNDTLNGTSGNDLIEGGDGDDFMLPNMGDDILRGGAGNDAFLFGASLSRIDQVDGGAGNNDQLGIQGNYTGAQALQLDGIINVEVFLLLSGSDTRFGDTSGAFYSYDIKSTNQNIVAGGQLIVDANALRLGENVIFNGSAETDGSFFVYAGQGTDVWVGGARNDVFLFRGPGGFTSADRLDGGGGTSDQIGLRGDYLGANAVTFDAGTITNIEGIVLISGFDSRFGGVSGIAHSYDLTIHDANVAAGQLMTVDAGSLRAGERASFNGSAETNGFFQLFGGESDDVLVGGSGADSFRGGLGADRLTGGAGADTFSYRSVTESGFANPDWITDFQSGSDKIDLSSIDANTGNGTGNDAFSFIGSSAFSRTAGELRLSQDGVIFVLEGDIDGNGTADFILNISISSAQPISITDFVL